MDSPEADSEMKIHVKATNQEVPLGRKSKGVRKRDMEQKVVKQVFDIKQSPDYGGWGARGARSCGAEAGVSACVPAAFVAAAAGAGTFPEQKTKLTEECNQVMSFSSESE